MGAPHHHRHRSEYCPSCDLLIGTLRRSARGGSYLQIEQAKFVERVNPGEWRIVCGCGQPIKWFGAEFTWRDPQMTAA